MTKYGWHIYLSMVLGMITINADEHHLHFKFIYWCTYNIYLHFPPLLNIKMTQANAILAHWKQLSLFFQSQFYQ